MKGYELLHRESIEVPHGFCAEQANNVAGNLETGTKRSREIVAARK